MAALRAGGLIEQLVLTVCGQEVSVAKLIYGLTASIAVMALVVHSTSARAARSP